MPLSQSAAGACAVPSWSAPGSGAARPHATRSTAVRTGRAIGVVAVRARACQAARTGRLAARRACRTLSLSGAISRRCTGAASCSQGRRLRSAISCLSPRTSSRAALVGLSADQLGVQQTGSGCSFMHPKPNPHAGVANGANALAPAVEPKPHARLGETRWYGSKPRAGGTSQTPTRVGETFAGFLRRFAKLLSGVGGRCAPRSAGLTACGMRIPRRQGTGRSPVTFPPVRASPARLRGSFHGYSPVSQVIAAFQVPIVDIAAGRLTQVRSSLRGHCRYTHTRHALLDGTLDLPVYLSPDHLPCTDLAAAPHELASATDFATL